jgi:RNA polymerase sigma-70 factor (ECF subfamily)
METQRNAGPIPPDPTWPSSHSVATVDRLLRQVARGDHDAFGDVYRQVAAPVYGLVHLIVEDPARAEQVTGDVLTEVWRTAPAFSPADGTGLSWIMSIARRRAAGHVRPGRGRAARGPRLAQLINDISERAGLNRPDDPAAARLAALPEPQRQALVLACYGGYTQAQLADLLDVPASTVAAWLRDALPAVG